MSTPADDVAAQIAAQIPFWVEGTNLFVADILPVFQTDQSTTGSPSNSTFVTMAGGYTAPQRYQQGNYASVGPGVQAREPRLMIYVRSERQDYYTTGLVAARAVKDAVHDQLLQIGTSGVYYDACRIVDAEPMLLSTTDEGEFIFSMNCHLYLDT